MNETLSGSRAAKNAAWIIAGRLLNILLSFLVGLLSARYLGPGNFGLINYAALYITLFTAFASLGLSSVTVKLLIEYPEEQGETLGTATALRAASGLLSAVMTVAFVSIVDAGEPLTVCVAALCGASLFFQAAGTISHWFQARLMSKYSALASGAACAVCAAYKTALLLTGRDVRWFAAATALEYCVSGALLFVMYKKRGGPGLSFSAAKARRLLSAGTGFILSGTMVAIYNCTDRFMLKHLLGGEAVGCYAAAVSISMAWAFVLGALIDSLHPAIMQAHSRDRRLFDSLNRRLYAMVFYIALCASAAICALAPYLTELLYGESFAGAVQPLRIITWYTGFAYLGTARGAWTVCENRQNLLTPVYVGAALTNAALNFLLIPRWGASGAAAASLAAQFSTVFVFPFFIGGLRENARLMLEAVLLKNILPERVK